MSRSKRKALPPEPIRLKIESFSHEGRGVAHVDGKTVFVDGALPGEEVLVRLVRSHRRYDDACTVEVFEPSPDRVVPLCPWFADCGGCALQHMAPERQIELKQTYLLENLTRLGSVKPAHVLPPVTGPVWNYRHKARLGVRNVVKKGRVLVGFREKFSGYLTVMDSCPILHPAIADRLGELATLIAQFRDPDTIAQIELAAGDQAVVLVIRHLAPLEEAELTLLRRFGDEAGVAIYLQPQGVASIRPMDEAARVQLSYALADHQIDFCFEPSDFTQINPAINRQMINQAIDWLAPRPEDTLLDLFCGLGNFTLPLARRVKFAAGIDGEPDLIRRAGENAARNGLDNVRFAAADLTLGLANSPFADLVPELVLIDPPRSGALDVLPWVGRLKPRRILYVSCHPASLARDAGVLVNEWGYRLEQVGVMDMFPHTSHVESMALFVRKGG